MIEEVTEEEPVESKPKEDTYSILKIEEESEDEDESETLDVSEKTESKPMEHVKEISPEENKEVHLIKEIRDEVEKLKQKASEEHQKGMFENAIELYEKALKLVDHWGKQIKIRHNEIIGINAALWNNISLGYKQMQNSDGEIEYASRVINSKTELIEIGMSQMVQKALLRRGYCYEREEKSKKAKADFEEILKLTPHDLEAKTALWWVNEAIKHHELEEWSRSKIQPS